jgi:hypothetical protein
MGAMSAMRFEYAHVLEEEEEQLKGPINKQGPSFAFLCVRSLRVCVRVKQIAPLDCLGAALRLPTHCHLGSCSQVQVQEIPEIRIKFSPPGSGTRAHA